MSELTHIGADGRARMVDVTDKTETDRVALAHGYVRVSEQAFDLAVGRETKKGDPIAIAELAGIMAAKRTADLIPLCHPLPITGVKVDITPRVDRSEFEVVARVKTTGKTGVEMEALTSVSAACLTLYDMLKAVDKSIVIHGIELLEKTGGKSGMYRKSAT
ncbi:MAG: cyclic pyranopterin monophosphate synthase MoaC [Hyphomonadaceae bacterium]|nr:cyclic pyranopterin monophosphate synthase MoaC [Hyphomonadaceae bacterium]